MTFAIVQKELSIPPVDRLREAFRSVSFLTDMDAFTLAQDAYGLLVRGVSAENAAALHAALLRAGIETEMVADRQLPSLPPTKFVRRMDCQPDGLRIYDPLGRSFSLAWDHLWLIAAGNVRQTDFRRIQTTRPAVRYDGHGASHPDPVIEVRTKEERNHHLNLELVLSRAVQRFSMTADRFHFDCLGGRVTDDPAENFRRFVQELVRCAPGAALNRGAFYLRENAPEIFAYPSKNAFFEELIWLLWQLAQKRESH